MVRKYQYEYKKKTVIIMRTRREVLARIQEFRSNILLLEDKINGELEKEIEKTDALFLRFLHKEKSVYAMAVEQLEWLLNDN